jgi:hypothetical protein
MEHTFEYEFVRLEKKQRDKYQQIVREYAAQGWRLVQVLAPGAGGSWGSADYFELILERRVS